MSLNSNRVIWTEGLFIQQQHFQQQERYLEGLARRLFYGACGQWLWGFTDFAIDTALLKLGKLGLSTAVGVLPDGTPFDAPENDPLPQPVNLGDEAVGQVIYLSLPLVSREFPEYEMKKREGDSMARYAPRNVEVVDNTVTGRPPSVMLVGGLGLRLGVERGATDGYVCRLPVARIVDRNADGSLIIDDQFVPPVLAYGSSTLVSAWVNEITGLATKRAFTLAARVAKPDHSSVAELAEFLILQCLNRHIPVLRHLASAVKIHPREVYQEFAAFAGDLAAFCRDDRLSRAYPDYDHDELFETFSPVLEDLRRALSMVIEQSAIALDLEERRHGVRVAVVHDPDLYTAANFVLAVQAQVPAEALRLRLPTQMKVGPIDKIRDLVNLHLPGIALNWQPVAPRQIPYHAGFHYFELDRSSELWAQLARSGGVALHLAGEFPGLQLEFWAIREDGGRR